MIKIIDVSNYEERQIAINTNQIATVYDGGTHIRIFLVGREPVDIHKRGYEAVDFMSLLSFFDDVSTESSWEYSVWFYDEEQSQKRINSL